MADLKKRLPENVEGEFFVDSTCINCDACRQLAPEIFAESGDCSYVYAQPHRKGEERGALRALLACPTGSIGTLHRINTQEVRADFPLLIEDDVYTCGFNSPKSYGGNSYFVKHAQGNWLIDSPKYLPHLAKRFDEMGGIKYIFLTHRDDVAEARKYAQKFSSQRIIHRHELFSQPDAEIVIEGFDLIELRPSGNGPSPRMRPAAPTSPQGEFLIIPTTGHTRGHCVLLYKNRFLFTGDHLAWDRDSKQLDAYPDVCWYSWPEQTKSMAILWDFVFEWVLPGHGQRVKLPANIMQRELGALLERMRGAEQ